MLIPSSRNVAARQLAFELHPPGETLPVAGKRDADRDRGVARVAERDIASLLEVGGEGDRPLPNPLPYGIITLTCSASVPFRFSPS